MTLLARIVSGGFEQVVLCHDRPTGLRSIIAIHDTRLGPALGGVRMRPYESDAEAIEDCLRLAEGMTYKAAAAGLNQGGGKSVIIGDPAREKTEGLLRAHARFIDTLGGRYIGSFDLGTSPVDVRTMASETSYVAGFGDDPSPYTALGVYSAIRAAVEAAFASPDLAGRRIAIQGVGHVGGALAALLAADGCHLLLADADGEQARSAAAALDAELVDATEIVSASCDVFAPCAVGAVIDDQSLARLRCRVIAGGANNVLADPRHGEMLHRNGILYVPDFLANAGGIVFLEEERLGHGTEQIRLRVQQIGDLVTKVLELSRARDQSPAAIANELAEERLVAAGARDE